MRESFKDSLILDSSVMCDFLQKCYHIMRRVEHQSETAKEEEEEA